jgi:hypothetical protein
MLSSFPFGIVRLLSDESRRISKKKRNSDG